MANESLDPSGHVKISVNNSKISKQFYDKILSKINWKKISEGDWGAGWVSPLGFGFWIEEAEHKEPRYKFASPGIHHFCFKARTKEEVNEFYKFLLEENVYIYDRPESYPEYTDKYYAVFFSDPDGIKLELAYY